MFIGCCQGTVTDRTDAFARGSIFSSDSGFPPADLPSPTPVLVASVEQRLTRFRGPGVEDKQMFGKRLWKKTPFSKFLDIVRTTFPDTFGSVPQNGNVSQLRWGRKNRNLILFLVIQFAI